MISHCAHRTSIASLCAFCEQEGQLATLPLIFYSILRAASLVLHCARPTRVFRDRALREHRGPVRLPFYPHRISNSGNFAL